MNDIKQIEQVLKEEGMLVCTTAGISMYPMLRNRRDTIVVKPYEGRLKKYDIPLYKRESDSAYILHRIIKVLPDSYIICGDNCDTKEYGIGEEHILGVLTAFCRGDKWIDMNGWKYKLYVRLQCATYPFRWFRGKARRVKAKIIRLFRKEESHE